MMRMERQRFEPLPPSSGYRFAAGDAGFLILIQSFDRPNR